MAVLKQLVYALLDLFSFYKGIPRTISGFRIRFPARWFRYFEPDYEKENVLFLQNTVKPGHTGIDVGAHLGLMSVIAAQLSGPNGRVFAFEPSPSTFSVLKKVCGLNRFAPQITCIQAAVTEKAEEVSFYLSSDKGSNSNSLVQKHALNRTAIRIPGISLDVFAEEQKLSRLDWIKIDAEGSELSVLRGATTCMSRFRPAMVLAIHPRLIKNNGHEIAAIYRLLSAQRYTVLYKGQVLSEQAFCGIPDFFDVHLLPA